MLIIVIIYVDNSYHFHYIIADIKIYKQEVNNEKFYNKIKYIFVNFHF